MSGTSSSATALLLIDVINDMNFPKGGELPEHTRPAAERIAGLRDQIRRCMRPDSAGREIAGRLLPERDDYFVLKPKQGR